jgi:glucose-1-phosphate cytidylyltransferase|tara:strand:+ start:1007 stop:1780 length:774 start_codon:yes stop_codon:yes gene_type:complete
MIAVILAGGHGTRLSEETKVLPKPMVEIGGKPILWHIMKMYSAHGINDFVICCGYKGYLIKEYFSNYFLYKSDVTFSIKENNMVVHEKHAEPWMVTLVDTGDNSMTGGRLGRVANYIKNEDFFCMTYGDGLSNVDITNTIKFHQKHGKQATVTAAYPPARFGALTIKDGIVKNFIEKPKGEGTLINSGFFVLSPNVLKKITGDDCIWEKSPLIELTKEKELMAYEHYGFWQPMDTLHDKNTLETLWQSGKAPWKNWE